MRFPPIFLFLVFGISLGAAQLPDARQLLAHSDDSLFAARTAGLAYDMTADVTVSGIETKAPVSVLLRIGGANRFRYSARLGDSNVLVVSNGTNVWRSSSKEKTWTVATFEPGSLRQHVENIVYGRGLANIRDARVDRKESIDVKGRSVDCYVVRAEYQKIPGFPNSGMGNRTVWLDVNQNLVWRDEWEGQASVPSGATAHIQANYVYSELEFDKELSADLFSFQPPEGSVQATPPTSMPATSNGSVAGISHPAVIHKVDPEYSEQARKSHLSGTVTLSTIVDTEGNAREIHVIKSLGMGLDEKAMEAVQKWKFRPAMKGATPVNTRATVEVNFRLLAPAWAIDRVKFQPAAGTQAATLRADVGTPWDRTCTQRGTVVIRLTVSIDGQPAKPKVLQTTNNLANKSALDTIMSSRFNPALQDGKPVPSEGEVELSCADRITQPRVPAPPPPPANIPAVAAGGILSSMTGNAPIANPGGSFVAPQGFEPGPGQVYVPGDVLQANLIHQEHPDYPPSAKAARVEGTVALKAIIATDGTVKEVSVVSGPPLLVQAAMDAVRKWLYKPTLLNGKPVEVITRLEVNFTLSN